MSKVSQLASRSGKVPTKAIGSITLCHRIPLNLRSTGCFLQPQRPSWAGKTQFVSCLRLSNVSGVRRESREDVGKGKSPRGGGDSKVWAAHYRDTATIGILSSIVTEENLETIEKGRNLPFPDPTVL